MHRSIMVSKLITLHNWWETLDNDWRELIIDQLELNGCFAEADIEFVLTITELDCSGSSITDLAPVTQLTHLKSLDISNTPVTDLSPLVHLPYLRELHASFCGELDLSVLEQMPQLEVLDISYPQDLEIKLPDLSLLDNLRELYCNACGVRSVVPFIGNSRIEVICAFFNPIPKVEITAYREMMPGCKVLF
ncbi:MAG: leucine-rich repeat domain-containing protein [Bacteroidia bacterium]|nr:leucine-rich repeat domain-containing protein [Bacteroidia bacterium]